MGASFPLPRLLMCFQFGNQDSAPPTTQGTESQGAEEPQAPFSKAGPQSVPCPPRSV